MGVRLWLWLCRLLGDQLALLNLQGEKYIPTSTWGLCGRHWVHLRLRRLLGDLLALHDLQGAKEMTTVVTQVCGLH